MSNEFYWIAVAAVTILSAARITRLFVYDDFPPIAWVRARFTVRTEGSDWQLLAKCGFCMSFWVTAAIIAWGYFSGVYEPGDEPVGDSLPWFSVWILVNGTFAASYLAASFIARDGDKS